jgi:hypothetical protein
MLAEIGADEVKSYGIDAGICVGKDEANNLQRVPEMVVIDLRIGVKVEPQKEDVHRQKTNEKEGN